MADQYNGMNEWFTSYKVATINANNTSMAAPPIAIDNELTAY